MTHEMAHIVHLTRPRNRPGLLERLLPLPIGPVLFNSPRWVIGRVRDARRGRADGLGAAALELPRDGAAPVRDRGEAPVLRRALLDVRLARRLDGLPRGIGVPGMARGARREGISAEALEADGFAPRRELRDGVSGGLRTSPADLYDRFRAEVTAGAIEEEKRLERPVSRGRALAAARGGRRSPQVSPDGSKILARRDPRRRESFLAVWTVEETDGGAPGRRAAQKREEEALRDANEVADKVRAAPARAEMEAAARQRVLGANPRWMPDGSAYSRAALARREGVLRWDLYLWEVESGHVTA